MILMNFTQRLCVNNEFFIYDFKKFLLQSLFEVLSEFSPQAFKSLSEFSFLTI